MEKQISDQSTGETDDGVTTYKSYETIATVQKDAGEAPADSDYTEVQKNFSTSVNALGKSLGDILGTVLSSSGRAGGAGGAGRRPPHCALTSRQCSSYQQLSVDISVDISGNH